MARSSVSIRDAKFLLGRRRRQAQCLGEQERWEVLGIGSTTVLGPLWVFTLVRPLARHAPCLTLANPLGGRGMPISTFSLSLLPLDCQMRLCGWPCACAAAPFSLARQS